MGKYGCDQILNQRSIQRDAILARIKKPRNRGFLPMDLEGHRRRGWGVGVAGSNTKHMILR